MFTCVGVTAVPVFWSKGQGYGEGCAVQCIAGWTAACHVSTVPTSSLACLCSPRCVFLCQQLLDEQLSVKQSLYLASFGTDVQPLWASETPRIVNPALYDAAIHLLLLPATWWLGRWKELEVHRLSADNRYQPIIVTIKNDFYWTKMRPEITIGNRSIIGRLFGVDNRPADNRPKHYRCTSRRNPGSEQNVWTVSAVTLR